MPLLLGACAKGLRVSIADACLPGAWQPASLEIVGAGVFLIIMLNNVPQMARAALVVLEAEQVPSAPPPRTSPPLCPPRALRSR